MKKLIFLFSLCLILNVVKSNTVPIHEWTILTSSPFEDRGEALVVNQIDGNVYVTGSTRGQIGLLPNVGGKDIFLIKYDENGNILWKRQWGTLGDESGKAVAIDYDDGSVYIVGYTNGNLHENENSGGYDAFLMKVDADGIKLWTKMVGSTLNDYAYGVAVKPLGLTHDVYITGYASGEIAGQPFNGSKDILLAKYSPGGEQKWVNLCGTSSDEEGYAVAVSSSLNEKIYVTGYTKGNLDSVGNSGQADIFIRKYSNTGLKEWTILYGGLYNDMALSMYLDVNFETEIIYIAGFHGGIDGLPYYGERDIILAKYDSGGIQEWVKVAGTSEVDKGFGIAGTLDSIYVCGITGGDLNGVLNNQTFNDTKDVFLMKYSSAGEYVWTDLVGINTNTNDFGLSVGATTSEEIFVTGYTYEETLNDIILIKYTEEEAPLCIKPGNTKDCGFCGLMTCLDTNYWSECENEGVCEANTTKVCPNICKTKICDETCLWGTCLIHECDGGSHCTGCTCDAEYEPTVPPSEDCVSISSESSSSSVQSSSSVASSLSSSISSSSGSVGSSSSIGSSSSSSSSSSSGESSESSSWYLSLSSYVVVSDAGKICPTRTISSFWIFFLLAVSFFSFN